MQSSVLKGLAAAEILTFPGTPVEMHVEVRERREHRELPLEKDQGVAQG
jgi:hypothetical protein